MQCVNHSNIPYNPINKGTGSSHSEKVTVHPDYLITIIGKISPNQFLLKCSCCKGSGKMSQYHDGRSPYTPCTVCNGKGLATVEIDGSAPFVKCSLCKGTGEQSQYYDDRSPYKICTKCKGVGAQPITGTMRLAS